MIDQATKAKWDAKCDEVLNQMKVFTRPYVAILAGGDLATKPKIGTGTFIESAGVQMLTCEHVSKPRPEGFFVNNGYIRFNVGEWCEEPDVHKDIAFAPVPVPEWAKLSSVAQPLPLTKFAPSHSPVPMEVLFFRGIAGQNVYIGSFGPDAIITGYQSQEKKDSGDANIFEILWSPKNTTVGSGLDPETCARFKYDDPAGFSGSLVWNTRFVEGGCDLNKWKPEDAVVTGLLRRYDKDTDTLLAWRIEHARTWLRQYWPSL